MDSVEGRTGFWDDQELRWFAGPSDEIPWTVSPRLVIRELARALLAEREEHERERIRLAGCGVAALGYVKADEFKPGDYAHSASLDDVMALRAKLTAAEAERDASKQAIHHAASEALEATRTLVKWREKAEALEAERDALGAENARLREALKFYAADENWEEGGSESNGPAGWVSEPSSVLVDGGDTAREALGDER